MVCRSSPNDRSCSAGRWYPRSRWCTPRNRLGPSAAAAAITLENPARTSGISTSAPRSLDTPRTTAECRLLVSWKRQAGPAQAAGEQGDLAAHLLQRRNVHEPVLVDRLVQHRHPLRLGEEHHQSGVCQSVMKPGCTSVCTAAARRPSGRRGRHAVVVHVDPGAHAHEGGDGGHQAVLTASDHPDLAAGQQAGHQVAERLVAVTLKAGAGTPQSRHTLR